MLNKYFQYVLLSAPHANDCELALCSAPDIQCDCGAQRHEEALLRILNHAREDDIRVICDEIELSDAIPMFERACLQTEADVLCLKYLADFPSSYVQSKVIEFVRIADSEEGSQIIMRATYALIRQRAYLKEHGV